MTLQEFYDQDPEKWCQGELLNSDGARCLVGALDLCYPGWEAFDTAHRRLLRAIETLFPEKACAVSDFNDHGDTTFEEVLKVVRKANV